MKINIILALFGFFFLHGCYEDKGNYDYKDLNTIRIVGFTDNERDYENGYEIGSLVKISPKLKFALDSVNVHLGYKWILCGREIGHERNLEWIADTAGFLGYANFYLQIHDSTNGLDYLSGLFSGEENVELSLYIRNTSLAGGWLIVTKRDGNSVIDYVKMDEEYDSETGEYYYIPTIIHDVYAARNGGEKLEGDIKALECTWVERGRNSSQVLILQNGGIGPVYVDGASFTKSVMLADEFINGQLPPDTKFIGAYDKPKGSILITEKGQVYLRRKDDPNAYFTGRYPDYSVMVDKGMVIDRLTSYRYDDLIELAFDHKNNRFLMFLDRFGHYSGAVEGGVFSPVYQADKGDGHTMLSDMGDVDMIYYGGYMEGDANCFLTLFKNNNPDKGGLYYIEKFECYQDYQTDQYEIKPLVEKVFPDQHLINGHNVFAVSPKTKQYLLFSTGELQDKLYGYMFAGEEGGVANSKLLYDFGGRSIKSIVITGVSSRGVYVGVALGNGEICEITVSADAFMSGVKAGDIDFYPANFGEIQFMVQLEAGSTSW